MSTTAHDAEPIGDARPTSGLAVFAAWVLVATPICYGLWQTLLKALQLFTSH